MEQKWPTLKCGVNDEEIEKRNFGIILDLDQTLIYTFDGEETDYLMGLGVWSKVEYLDLRHRIYKMVLDDVMESKRGVGERTELWGIMRPHVKKFLAFCFKYFQFVAVWSAGRRKYVEALVDILFAGLARPHVVYTYDHCVAHQRGDAKILAKPILKMVNCIPKLSSYIDLNNCLILDDADYSFIHTNKDNGILIPPFKPKILSRPGAEVSAIQNLRADETSLLKFMAWLKLQPNIDDWRLVDKTQIFNSNF